MVYWTATMAWGKIRPNNSILFPSSPWTTSVHVRSGVLSKLLNRNTGLNDCFHSRCLHVFLICKQYIYIGYHFVQCLHISTNLPKKTRPKQRSTSCTIESPRHAYQALLVVQTLTSSESDPYLASVERSAKVHGNFHVKTWEIAHPKKLLTLLS